MNKIYIFERVLNEAVLEFTIVDTEAEAIYSVIGDIEALQSALFETYRLDKTEVVMANGLVAERIVEVGFNVKLVSIEELKPEYDEQEEVHTTLTAQVKYKGENFKEEYVLKEESISKELFETKLLYGLLGNEEVESVEIIEHTTHSKVINKLI